MEDVGQAEGSRLSRGAALIRDLVSHRRAHFVIAVSGAAVFAFCTAGSSLGVRWMIDHVILPRFDEGSVRTGTVVTAALLLVGIAVTRAAGVVVRRTYAGKAEWGVAEELGRKVLERYAQQPVAWHRRHQAGDLVARANVDVEAAVAVLAPLPYGSSVVLLLVTSAVGLTVLDPALGAVALVVLPLLVLLNIGYQRRVDRHFNEAQEQMGRLSEAALESFEGVTVVKAFGAEERETERLTVITGRLRDARVHAMRARATFEMTLDMVPSLANLVMLSVGAVRVRDGAITVGDLAAAMYLFTLLVIPLRLIGFVFSEIPHSSAGFRRIMSILEEPLVEDPAGALVTAPDGTAVAAEGVALAHVPEIEVLAGATFNVRAGATVAVVGHTGSGKSTLLQAIAGLVPTVRGSLQVCPGPREIVFQEAFLFSESVRFNLTMGADIPEQDIRDALTAADAGFLLSLENGLDTSLGERGVSLSGGQRQRLALARALARRPALLMLDDTTSALDPQTEMKVLAALRSSDMATTTILVASRPAAIASADSVLFIAQGGVLHSGTHESLYSSLPGYRELLDAFEEDRQGEEDR